MSHCLKGLDSNLKTPKPIFPEVFLLLKKTLCIPVWQWIFNCICIAVLHIAEYEIESRRKAKMSNFSTKHMTEEFNVFTAVCFTPEKKLRQPPQMRKSPEGESDTVVSVWISIY